MSINKVRKIDLSVIKKEHEGKWLALSTDYKKIVDYSDSLSELGKKVKGKDVVYTKALPSDTSFAF